MERAIEICVAAVMLVLCLAIHTTTMPVDAVNPEADPVETVFVPASVAVEADTIRRTVEAAPSTEDIALVAVLPERTLVTVESAEPAETEEPDEPEEPEEPDTEPEPEPVKDEPEPSPYERDVELLACVIYQEVGADAISDLTRFMVGDVVLNRLADPRYPDTIEGVLLEKDQWGRYYYTGVIWPEWASDPWEQGAVARAYATARALLRGEHSYIYGKGYIFMAEFVQGEDVIFRDGCYFGRG